jgi:hypothetical protein
MMRLEMNTKTTAVFLACIIAIIIFSTFPALAQEEEPEINFSMSRDFGYSSGTGDIQGTFSMKVNDTGNLSRVDFLIDEVVIFEDQEPPYRYQFNTGDFDLGVHSLSVIGYTKDGQELHSLEKRLKFVSPEEGGKFVLRIIVPLFAVIFGLMALSYLPMVLRRGKTIPLGEPRKYGIIGGTICKNCGRPFAFNFFSPRLLVGRLDHCPHCGKWGLLQRKSLDELRAAEQAELTTAEEQQEAKSSMSDEEKLKKALDDSRYQDF